MRNLYTLFMASAFLMSLGCSPTTPLHPGSGLDVHTGIENVSPNARAEAIALMDSDQWAAQPEDGEFDNPFELEFNDESKISEIRTTSTGHSYSLSNSIVKEDTRIFLPTHIQWTEESVVVFLIKEENDVISGKAHVISSEMMRTIDTETLEDINDSKVKATFEVAASEIQASSTLEPNVIYAVTVNDEKQLRAIQADEETDDNAGQ